MARSASHTPVDVHENELLQTRQALQVFKSGGQSESG